MAWELFQDGTALGAVSDMQFQEGKQEFHRVRSLGGTSELIPGLKNPAEVTFTSPSYSLNIVGSHELRDSNSNQTIRILIDRISGTSVHALVQPDKSQE